jgi:hypothetical protein
LTGGHQIGVAGEGAVHIKALSYAFESWLPAHMSRKVT